MQGTVKVKVNLLRLTVYINSSWVNLDKLGRSLKGIFKQLQVPRSSGQTIANTGSSDVSPLYKRSVRGLPNCHPQMRGN